MSLHPDSLTGLDTNVLLRALLQDDASQSPIVAREMHHLTTEHRGFITSVTLAEVHWVLSRSMKMPRRNCLAVMRQIIESEEFEFDDNEGVAQALTLAEEGADFADALIQTAMEQFGVDRVITFDRKAADRLGWTLLGEE